MKPSEIKVGKTYANRGAGRTRRKVLDIGKHIVPSQWYGAGPRPNDPGVVFEQTPKMVGNMYLKHFAQWAGYEVNDK